MKKLHIILALGMTIPSIIASVYSIFAYGNFTGELGMGGFEILLFLVFIALPLGGICLVVFISRMIYLKVKQKPIKIELKYFIVPLIVGSLIGIILWSINNYCFENKCGFIPELLYSTNQR